MAAKCQNNSLLKAKFYLARAIDHWLLSNPCCTLVLMFFNITIGKVLLVCSGCAVCDHRARKAVFDDEKKLGGDGEAVASYSVCPAFRETVHHRPHGETDGQTSQEH